MSLSVALPVIGGSTTGSSTLYSCRVPTQMYGSALAFSGFFHVKLSKKASNVVCPYCSWTGNPVGPHPGWYSGRAASAALNPALVFTEAGGGVIATLLFRLVCRNPPTAHKTFCL